MPQINESVSVLTPDDEIEEPFGQLQPSLACGVAVLITTPQFKTAGLVQEIQPHALSVLVKHPLPERSVALVEFGEITREGEIISCQLKRGRYEVWIVIQERVEGDLRQAQRFPLTQDVKIHAASFDAPLEGKVVDLSAHGAGLETSSPLARGEIITVESDAIVAFGIVRHTRPMNDGRFQSGAEIFHIMPKGK